MNPNLHLISLGDLGGIPQDLEVRDLSRNAVPSLKD